MEVTGELDSSKTYTFNQLMEALIEVEEKLSRFYMELAERMGSPKLKEAFSTCGGESGKRSEALRRSRREAVVTRMGGLESTLEIALEPIHGIAVEYKLEKIRETIEKPGEALENVLSLDRTVSRLYNEVAEGVKQTFPEVSSLLSKMARENLKRAETLEASARCLP